MRKAQKRVIDYLHVADIFLRKAMVEAGEAKMVLVTESIKESEWHLDEAITKTAMYNQKKISKGVDKG